MYGSHLSIAGGMQKALLRAETLSMDTVQVFTKNQQQWKVPPLDAGAAAAWEAERSRLGFDQTVSHASYLINLASPDDASWERSVGLFVEELERCATLRIPYLVIHPGAHVGAGEEAGLARVSAALDKANARTTEAAGFVTTCLESTAGQGSTLGYKLEHLAEIIAGVKEPGRVAVCLDTAHLFAAGYDFRGRKYAGFKRDLVKTVGLDRVKVWHLNDSKKPLGSRVDRHEHIGLGEIGTEGFKPIVRDQVWTNVPKILETPKGEDDAGRAWDAVNLELLKSL